MRTLEFWVLGYLLHALWQAPLLLLAAWVMTRLMRGAGVAIAHRIWVGALFFEALLPACPLRLGDLWRAARIWNWGAGADGGVVRIAVGAGGAHAAGALLLPPVVIAGVFAAFAASLLYGASRLTGGLWRTHRLRREARQVIATGVEAELWRRCVGTLAAGGGGCSPAVYESAGIHGPVTVGMWRPALLVPPGFLERMPEADLEAVLAHECAHVLRRDFAKNLAYEAISLALVWHPAVRWTRAQVAESREMVCDAMAADAVAGRERYARSLLRVAALLAQGSPSGTVHAIGMGIFDANRFERRVMQLTQRRIEIGWSRRVLLAVAELDAPAAKKGSGVVALATCATALALRMDVAQPVAAASSGNGSVQVSPEVMAGQVAYKKPPVYPVEAKANHDTVDGPVVLRLVIGKDGAVEEIQVAQSLRRDYDLSALDAVREWRWKPYLLNGEPVEVETYVTVTYSIAH